MEVTPISSPRYEPDPRDFGPPTRGPHDVDPRGDSSPDGSVRFDDAEAADSTVPEADSDDDAPHDRPEKYSGRHEGSDRFKQFTRAGIVLTAVTALVVSGGFALYMYSDSTETDGAIATDSMPEPCEFVAGPVASDDEEDIEEDSDESDEDEAADEPLLAGWVSQEVSREIDRRTEESIQYFSCIYSAENSSAEREYRLLTLYSTLEVHETVPAAREAHTGALQFETGENRRVQTAGGIGERAAIIPIVGEPDRQEIRLYLQTANATASLSIFVSGVPPEDGDLTALVRQLAIDLVDSLPREG
ncbi:hypothetical protein [Natronoglycomyces albus]|uniref:Uncharacterized protein n=1 Tax=Natronoglycomyces albus TaxID=2811108 RepID=A0A895XUW7_9ACTN|nr:hypothetical protein [Natronoglycomyces albus]QSB06020.1 hypothetical protein JQS30_03600 [Natronoglycomyces albus]